MYMTNGNNTLNFWTLTGFLKNKMEEITKEIKLQRQRPAFARTISWEFSHSEEGQKKSKNKKQTREAPEDGGSKLREDINDDAIADNDGAALAGIIDGASRQHRLSTSEAVGDSASSNDREAYSALEDEIDESVATDDTFDTLDSLGNISIDTAERLDDDSAGGFESFDSLKAQDCSEVGVSNTGRRRRHSKKQKRKRRDIKVTFANEIMSLGNIFDVSEDIEMAVTDSTEAESVSGGNRQVPTLVQICMTSGKVESREKAGLPFGMRKLVIDWNKKQALLQKQLSWLQNRLLPISDNVNNFSTVCQFTKKKAGEKRNLFLYPTRSVWNGIASPVYPDWDGDQTYYTSGKAASFLLALSLHSKRGYNNLCNSYWKYNSYCTYQSILHMCNLSALASTIDLMFPAFITERSLGGRNITEQELLSEGFKTMLVRVKLALKARFPRMVHELFDKALPYVMWARGNVTMATEMFKNLILKEKRIRHKAMYLSEIARMNCEFNQTETAIKFYRLAAETAVGKPKYTDKDIEEVTEQTQVLVAGVHDNGLITPEKTRQSSACWNGALNLPKQRLATAVMAIEAFLCYHAAHLTDSCWQEEALAKIRNVEKTHQYLKYHASMILALQGKGAESRIKYEESLNGSIVTPDAWQSLLDIVANNKTPLKLLKVVWRRQLGTPKITNERPEEGQINSQPLNLHINSDGYLAGDIQNVLPPQRDISLDPYTGSTIITHVPSLTAPMQTSCLSLYGYEFEGLYIPTPQIIYSNESGTMVTMVKPSFEPSSIYCELPPWSLPEPFFLYWQNSSGQTAKINMIKAIQDSMKERFLADIVKRKYWSEERKTYMIQEMMPMYYDNNRAIYIGVSCFNKRGSEWEKHFGICEQQRLRPVCTSVQFD